jgi:hypothetical protein
MATLASQDTPPLSGLMLCGVPVEAIGSLGAADFAAGSVYENLGYASRRPIGTPLLAAPAAVAEPGPSACLLDALVSTLSARAGGESAAQSALPASECDARAQAQLLLSLFEVAAAAAGGPVAAPTPSGPAATPGGLGATFSAAAIPGPPWLSAALTQSRGRTGLIASPSRQGTPTGDAVEYAAGTSAVLQGMSPYGGDDAATGAARAAALAAAARIGHPLYPPPFPLGLGFPLGTPQPPWVEYGALVLAGRFGDSGPPLQIPTRPAFPTAVGGAGLGELLLEKFVAGQKPPPSDGGYQVYVLAQESVEGILATMDVMREHELRNMRD